jgi:hypothetical protein
MPPSMLETTCATFYSGALSSTKVVLYARNAYSGDRVPVACEVDDVDAITHRCATIYANPCGAITRVPGLNEDTERGSLALEGFVR